LGTFSLGEKVPPPEGQRINSVFGQEVPLQRIPLSERDPKAEKVTPPEEPAVNTGDTAHSLRLHLAHARSILLMVREFVETGLSGPVERMEGPLSFSHLPTGPA